MKILRLLITGTCVAAFTFLLPLSASAQGSKTKASPSPTADASPTATAKSSTKSESTTSTTTAASDKPARAIPFRGNVSSIDTSAKTFTIAGKTSTRVFKVIDETKITKAGDEAKLGDLTENEYVTGSYWKRDDGTLELKSLKIGGKTGTEKASSSKKKAKKDEASEDEEAEE